AQEKPMADEFNPYSAPQATVADFANGYVELPSRWLRLAGVVIDSILVSLITVPTMWFSGYIASAMKAPPPIATQLGWGVFGLVVFFAVHGWLLYSNGQTVAKKLLGMRIVDMRSRAKPGFARLVGMRF